jgi:hypothetical protein
VPTCWNTARAETCAEAEDREAEQQRNDFHANVVAGAATGVPSKVVAAEEAWVRNRDAHLRAFRSSGSCRREPDCTTCERIVVTWLTRGRIAEIERMVRPAGDHPAGSDSRDSAAPEEACEGSPGECRAPEKVREAGAHLAAKSRPAARARLRAAEREWERYRDAQTAATLASLGERGAKGLAESVRVRLSLARTSHLHLLSEFQADAGSRCARLLGEAALLADLKARCEAGQWQACHQLGQAFDWGWYSIDRDRPRAAALYARACDGGYAPACETLASNASVGRGTPRDVVSAADRLTRGCDLGDASCCQALASAHAAGRGVARDGAKALALARRACDLSRSDARTYWTAGPPCEWMATALETGQGLPQDTALSLELRQAACDRDEAGSCLRAARLLKELPGFDVGRVLSLYEKACRSESHACVELGAIYREGDAVAKDDGAALRWFSLACEGGFLPGCRAARAMSGDPPPGEEDAAVDEPGYISTMRILVHPALPALRLRLRGGDDYGVVGSIDVFDEGRRRVTQHLTVPGEEVMTGPQLPEQADLNFDGYQDLMLLQVAGANNAYRTVWTYEPRAGRFALQTELSDAPNLRVDAQARVVRSIYHFSAVEGSTAVYRWIGGRFVVVQEETRVSRPEGCLEHVTRERRGGRLVVTHQSCD